VRREGLEPSCLAASDPKSGASANSATFALRIKNQRIIAAVGVGHYENFPVASLLLPSALREPVEVIYRFARSADDFADEGEDPAEIRLHKLNDYRRQLAAPADPLFHEVAKIIREHELPVQLFADLLDAFSQDVTKKRYASYAELLDYCRRSANPVGRLLLHLFKRTTDSDLQQSDAICSALQLVNHWQDVDVDYTKDSRIYLPQDDMARFGVTERHLREKICDPAFQSLMAFQVSRARELMLSGQGLGKSLPGRIGLEIRATVQGGLRILEKIERAGYDVFRRRPKLRAYDWPLLLLKAV
jgi:squalene synthase HpnC